MSNRADLWALLIQRAGQWVRREDLDFTGGHDAGRRMREIRDDIVASGQYRLEEKKGANGLVTHVRLIQIEHTAPKQSMRFMWRCTKCDSHPADYMTTQPSLDPRWRFGPCTICPEKSATFRKVTP